MIVVADSGPIIALSAVGRLDLLAALYQRIVVPQQVYDEVVVKGAGLPAAPSSRRRPGSRSLPCPRTTRW